MRIGMVGLGRMGGNMVVRLVRGGHQVVAFDRDAEAVTRISQQGADGVNSLKELVERLDAPRAVWVMVPAGEPTEATIKELAGYLDSGDTIIDGANSNYKDGMRRSHELAEGAITFLDAGTSGGIWGLEEGYSLMVGGDKAAFDRIEPVFRTLAPSPTTGYAYVGSAGAGHFVKMVHNGIEYGMMQAYAEGFELMKAKTEFGFDLSQIAELWRHGSVVRSWLLDLTAEALNEDVELSDLESYVDDSGEGRWTVQESIELAVPLPVITSALQARFRSRQDGPFGGKMLAAMRNKFGGHAVKKASKSS